MAVTADLLNKIQDYRQQGYSSDEIVQGLAQSSNFGDVAKKVRAYSKGGFSPDEILQGIQSSPVAKEDAAKMRSRFMRDEADASTVAAGREKFIQDEGTAGTRIKEAAKTATKAAMPYVRPVLEGGGAALGGIAGAGAGGLAGLAGLGVGTVPGAAAGGVAGGALGYAIGKNLADTLEGDWSATPQEAASRTLADLATGATYEMGGQAVGPALAMAGKGIAAIPGAKAVGNALAQAPKAVLGKLSGVGPGAIDEAIASGKNAAPSLNPLKSQTSFDKALRGDTTGEEIVDSARAALSSLKEQRATTYQGQLQQIAQNSTPIDLRPVKGEVTSLMQKYNVQVDPLTGKLDTSRIAMGKTGRNDIKEIIETVSAWGSKPGDNTALGLDTLKRQLDDFYSDSSQARQFVTQLRNKVKDTITANIPQYDEMTKGYTEATKLIKDVEADLMMRKQGMSGRITADKTLRRLMSSMWDNFEMRRELVDILGAKGGEDLSGAIAGYTMNTVVPRGLAGTGPALAGQAAYAHYVNPSFWPVLAASSPRVQGEFLRMFGKASSAASRAAQAAKTMKAAPHMIAGTAAAIDDKENQ